MYVDDITITGSDKVLVANIITQLGVSFALKDLGHLHYFLGLQIEYSSDGIFVHQSKYAKDLLSKFHMMDCKPCSIPCAFPQSFALAVSPLLSDPTAYRSLVGALQYLTFTRPNLCYAVQKVCQFMSKPSQLHLVAAKRILRYLMGTLHKGIYLRPGSLTLSAYCDADWAGDPIDRRSITGMIVFLGNSPITWSSKKQTIVSRSSTEAEYKSLAHTTVELYWLRMLLKDLGVYLHHPPILWCDNVLALTLASNPIFHARTKHIEVDYYFV